MHRTSKDFIALLKPHYSSAVQYCRALYSNPRDAEDGLQDAIISAMQHFNSLRDDTRFKSWFFTIITRTFYRSQKKLASINKLFTALKESHHAFPVVYNDNHLGHREKIMLMALETLNQKERSAILLFEIGNLSLHEIQKVQKEKSVSAVKSRLSRTRLKLRNVVLEIEKRNHQQGGNYDKICIQGQ